ncbi:hypothetical protein COCC4DRAFT_64974 [Bipolaris maydis ATCC 48331]|uniref:Carboxypeptidase n=2 Tax=Cochliobolus heterostrophus TaxID=5016 RepID=M2UNU8_COCH5|nr:uncharacterized protein COCC4DRAFT_64974 [Bipolaris maydis ATCC 48331]EMD95261.1 hypothetical protein COCHEDRAFT_1222423 [Bipolaris maydis C5]KAJ5021878.1 Alpha/Beta hydrolase protein [Bipolaris maydis]ENI00848.1 hypothetical protein COCC4DRAFT_64974 [Bipolaris maydis ATCC 48331]KAJ5055052.1 Alpha/Beta hydrolase protein [Bipolaris maydis]KAJ6202926.1 Alpha/Beta hydrolase protein [Bipolaris maydis]
MKLLSVFGSFLCASAALAANAPRFLRPNRVHRPNPVIEKRVPGQDFQNPEINKRAHTFLNAKTQPFAVDGKNVPLANFDLGESYAGLLPISNDKNETRKLFFWFFPSTQAKTPEEIVIWLNGGPGCSSLSGLLQENGPFLWQDGTLAPTQNPYSWHNLTNMLWVEQPVGVGYSEGEPDISNEYELSDQFRGFYKNFVDLFGVWNWKTYVTGESYAGFYVPYIADSFIRANDKKYFNLGGIAINDPIIGTDTVQQQIVIRPYVEFWQNVFYLNQTFLERARKRDLECGYTQYYEKYFKFPPPKGPFPNLPDPFDSTGDVPICDQFDNYAQAIAEVNPCFDVYHITETCPFKSTPLGGTNPGDYVAPGTEVYFDRADVKKALHASPNSTWMLCTDKNVFAGAGVNGSDTSVPPANSGVLQNVIEKTNNVMIGSGDLDILLSTNGTLLALQNMTWNGAQGLTRYPSQNLYVPYHPEFNGGALAGAGYQGLWTKERGLTFYTARLAGHELPGYTPGVGYRMLEILLGRISDFSSTRDFTTQTGNFTGTTDLY